MLTVLFFRQADARNWRGADNKCLGRGQGSGGGEQNVDELVSAWGERSTQHSITALLHQSVYSHARYVKFQMAGVLVSESLFREILERIHRLKGGAFMVFSRKVAAETRIFVTFWALSHLNIC